MGRKIQQSWHLSCGEVSFRSDGNILTLFLDGRPSSALNLANLAQPVFNYMQWANEVLQVFNPPAGKQILHLGGAGCALPIAWAKQRPDLRQTVVELAGDLIQVVREEIDLPRGPKFKLRQQDGLEAIAQTRSGRWAVVVCDVFQGGVVPSGFTDLDFFAQVDRALEADGCFLANYPLGPGVSGKGVGLGASAGGCSIAQLKQFFPHLGVISPSSGWSRKAAENRLLVGLKTQLDWADLGKRLLRVKDRAKLEVL